LGNSREDIYKANSNIIKNDLYKKIYMACCYITVKGMKVEYFASNVNHLFIIRDLI